VGATAIQTLVQHIYLDLATSHVKGRSYPSFAEDAEGTRLLDNEKKRKTERDPMMENAAL
jgi:hypothetical protein